MLELADGTLIAECTAITEYLDSRGGKPVLTGSTPREKGVIHMMNKRAEIELLDAVSVYFHHATPGLGPDVEIYQNAEWGLRQRDKAERGMRYFDTVLRQHPFIAGDTFSMADITVIGGLIFAGLVDLQVPTECDALLGWYARMQERPTVQNRVTMSLQECGNKSGVAPSRVRRHLVLRRARCGAQPEHGRGQRLRPARHEHPP